MHWWWCEEIRWWCCHCAVLGDDIDLMIVVPVICSSSLYTFVTVIPYYSLLFDTITMMIYITITRLLIPMQYSDVVDVLMVMMLKWPDCDILPVILLTVVVIDALLLIVTTCYSDTLQYLVIVVRCWWWWWLYCVVVDFVDIVDDCWYYIWYWYWY